MSRRQQTALARQFRHKQTDAEKALWAILRRKQISGFKFRRQEPIGPYIVDFVSFEKRLIIEIDGGQHAEIQARARDEARSMWLRRQGYEVLRFWNNDVLVNREAVAESIRAALEREDSPSP
jgi:very-short-patch-repair endonuclease